MTRLCRFCDAPLPESARMNKKYCNAECREQNKKSKRREFMREYNKRPEVRARQLEWRRENNKRPEVKEWRRKWEQEYRQRPEVKERRKAYDARPDVKERAAKSAAKRAIKQAEEADWELLKVLVEMGVSDECLRNFGYEKVD